MKHLKLFFALFAMLALGVGNAWGAESLQVTLDFTTNSWNLPTSSKVVEEQSFTSGSYTIKVKGTSGNGYQFNSQKYLIMGKSGATLTLPAFDFNTTKIVVTGKSGASGSVQQNIYVGSTAVSTTTSGATGTNTYVINEAYQAAGNVYVLKVVSAANTQITKIEVYGESNSTEPPTPTTTYTIKWHTAKGVTTDVTLNEGDPITKPADQKMTGYEFMGWTASCSVASDGSDFTALTDFGTADSDKDFYAVFAKATTTGGEATTGSVTMKYSGTTTNMTEGNNAAAVNLDADEWSVVPTKGSASNMPGLNKDGDIRLYGHASGGNYLTITSKSYTITSAEITYTGTSYNNGKFYVNGVETAAGNINSKEFVIKNANSGTTQVRIKTLVINYTSGSAGTTTYSDYITTCASGIEYVELGDDFKWSAAEAKVTIDATDNVFPTLTNTHNVPVTYSSSDDAIASIASDGTVTLKKEGTVTITAKYEGGTSAGTGKEYKTKTVTYSLKVNKAVAQPTGTMYVKVTDAVTDGEYLIVYEDASNATPAPVAFNGALTTLDAVSNTIEVEINSNTIAGNTEIDAATFTIDATAKTVKSKSGYYIGQTSDANGLKANNSTKYENALSIENDGTATIKSGGAYLRYNSDANNWRFRYYKASSYSGQKAIALYKKASKHTVTIADCSNGSVSAKMGETALATNDQVLSGVQITLNNNPAENYKLAAYDVYKTGDATTRVTVADDNTFTMPEFDVTISATFEQLKELDKIEVNTTNVKTTFWQGETFNSTGLEVTAYYTDETSTIVTPKSITGSTAEAGTKQVTVSYTEGEITKETKYDITVKAIANEEESPYTVTEAREIIDAVGETTVGVYVQGIVSKIVTEYNATYGNISYNISEDGKTTSVQLQAYRGKSYNGEVFTSADDIQVDDKVVVKGKLKKHETIYEFAQDNQLVSLVRSTEPKPTAATLPFAFNGNKAAIETTAGMTQNGLGSDYSASAAPNSQLKFDGTGDWVVIRFDSEPEKLSYDIKNNSFSGGKFSVQESADGETYTDVAVHTTITDLQSEEYELNSASRYVKFIYTTKSSGNVGLGNISITKADHRQEAGLAWNPATISLTVDDAFTAPTFSNPNRLTVSFESSNTELATVNAGVISLVSGKTGTATITATYAGDETYKPAEVKCTISVSPKTENVVILAQYAGNWYALMAQGAVIDGVAKTDRLAALPVEYFNGTLYNVEDADKALITWERVVTGDKATFKNGTNYLVGSTSTTLSLDATEFNWAYNGETYLSDEDTRTFLYHKDGIFRNYGVTNASDGIDEEKAYSALPVVTAAKFETATFYTRSELTEGNYGTICLPYASNNYTGATFFEVVGKENNKIVFDEVTTLEAGKPYIFLAEATEIKVAQIGTAELTAQLHKSLQGTFTQIKDAEAGAAGNILEGNYMVVNNVIKKCGANCGLKANRAYFVATELDKLGAAPAQAHGVRRVSMGMAGQNTATGVDQVQGDEVPTKMIINGQLYILRGEKMYDAQGKLVK